MQQLTAHTRHGVHYSYKTIVPCNAQRVSLHDILAVWSTYLIIHCGRPRRIQPTTCTPITPMQRSISHTVNFIMTGAS